jgi:regulator of sigma E protease
MNFSLFKKTYKGTEYGLGWFPLGGYVKIAGMIDESADKEAMKGEPQPWEYRSKKSYQKLLIMLGGIIMNILLAMVIYIGIFTGYGETTLPIENVQYGVHVDSLGRTVGLMEGDKIVKVGDVKIETFDEIGKRMIMGQAKSFTVNRDGKETVVNIPDGTIRQLLKSKKMNIMVPRFPFVIDSISDKSINASVFQKGDKVIGLGNVSSPYQIDIAREAKKIVKANPDEINKANVTILRGEDTVTSVAKINANAGLDVYALTQKNFLEYETIDYSFIQAIPKGISHTGQKLLEYIDQLKLIITSPEVKVSESLGGFGSIGGLFPGEFNLFVFLQLTAFISIILAFMNLLPIPGLDGGYVLFLLFEMITGVKVKDSVIEKANGVGLVLLLALMLYANGLDVWRLFQ